MRRPALVLSGILMSVAIALGSPTAGAESNWTWETIARHTVWYQNFSSPPRLPGPNTPDEKSPNHRFTHTHVEVARWDHEDVPIIFVSNDCAVETWDPRELSPTGCVSLSPGDLTWITESEARQVVSDELVNGLIRSARKQRNLLNRFGLRVFVFQ